MRVIPTIRQFARPLRLRPDVGRHETIASAGVRWFTFQSVTVFNIIRLVLPSGPISRPPSRPPDSFSAGLTQVKAQFRLNLNFHGRLSAYWFSGLESACLSVVVVVVDDDG